MRTTISALIALIAGIALAAGQVKITFPDASGKTIWVLSEMPSSLPPGGREFTVKTVNLSIPDGLENGTILILDQAKGNVAVKSVAAAKSGWKVAESDWGIAEAMIQVELDSKPLNVGIVTVTGGGRQISSTISKGEGKLFNVPVGQIQVTVKYGQVGAETISPPQTQTLSLERTELVPIIKISIATQTSAGEKEETDEQPPPAKEPAKEETTPPPKSEVDEGGGILAMCGSFLLWLLVLVGVATLLLLAIRYLKAHQGKVAGGLQALGIQIPDGSETAGIPVSEPASKEAASKAPVVQPGHCQYCGQPESQCACHPGGPRSVADPGGLRSVAAGSAPTHLSHRLVSDAGISLAIPSGVSIIGREAGSAQLVVSDPTVSRIHAEIEISGDRIVLRDKGSSNGTFVNGSKITTDTEIRNGDVVQFGAVRMRVET